MQKSSPSTTNSTRHTNYPLILCYLADILTFSRLILALALLALAIAGGSLTGGVFYHFITQLPIPSAEAATIGHFTDAAFVIFLTAELTDAFDGTCARKWPFPKGHVPKYRKYAPVFDMVADALLAAAQILYVTNNICAIFGFVVIFIYTVVFGSVELIIYGKLFGHPDDCEPNSLVRRNFHLAKKIIMTRRYIYAALLGIINAFILFATTWSAPVKGLLFLFGCSIYVFAWFFLRERHKHITRNAVALEDRLEHQSEGK